MDLRPGDIVFERSPGWIGRAVRWATRGRHEPPTRVNHVGIIVLTQYVGDDPRVIEALWTVRINPISTMQGAVEVWRLAGVNDVSKQRIVDQAIRYIGRGYGWRKLGAHLVDALFTKVRGTETFFFRRLLRMDRYPICSWLVAWVYYRSLFGYSFGVLPQTATPDDIHDHVTSSEDWKRVYKREALKA